MRVGPQPIIARPTWYDRAPTPRVDHYWGQGIGPHAVTTRLTYTCPALKKAMVEVLQVRVRRQTAATTLGLAGAYAMLTPSGGSAKEILDAYLSNNTVDARNEAAIGTTLMLFAGDVLDLRTYDASTGGTCDYFVCYKITEFDA